MEKAPLKVLLLSRHNFNDKISKTVIEKLKNCEYDKINISKITSLTNLNYDIAIVIGGDGTILRVLNLIHKSSSTNDKIKPLPVFGINTGHLGFLTEIECRNVDTALDEIINKNFKIENRLALNVKLYCGKTGKLKVDEWAINEVAIEKNYKLIELDVKVNKSSLMSYSGNGVLVATPTGSTAYSFSAGGPLISPKSSVFAFVPLAPHHLFNRPMVIDSDENLEIILTEDFGNNASMSCDGFRNYEIKKNDKIVITTNDTSVKFARLTGNDFIDRLKSKFVLPESSLRKLNKKQC